MLTLTMEQLTLGLVVAALIQVLAIVASPLAVLWIQKQIETRQSKIDRRRNIFKLLMATRASKLSLDHVQALNAIDVEFYDKSHKCKAVIDAWEEYKDYLTPINEQQAQERTQPNRDSLFQALMVAMADSLGYQFKKSDIRSSAYMPRYQVDAELEWGMLRRALLSVTQRGIVPVEVYDSSDESMQSVIPAEQATSSLAATKPYATNPITPAEQHGLQGQIRQPSSPETAL